jgi:hypothetical protein
MPGQKVSKAMVTTSKQCRAKNRYGEPCGAFAVNGSDYCYWHDPAKAKARAEARRRGGQARHGRKLGQTGGLAERLEERQFRTLADMIALLEVAVRQTLSLENSIARNRCLGYLARCWADLYQAGELEERVTMLEKAIIGGVKK